MRLDVHRRSTSAMRSISADQRGRPHPGLDRAGHRRGSCAASRCARARAAPTGRCSRWPIRATSRSTGLVVVPHYQMAGSGLLWPDLGLSRVVAITPSHRRPPGPPGQRDRRHLPHHARSSGAVITFVAELRTSKLPQIYLWEPDAYKDKVNSFTLYHGIVIGIAGLLALFLTILFVVKGSVMFPGRRRARLVGARLHRRRLPDSGGKVFDMSADAERIWRASGEGDPCRHAAGVPVRLPFNLNLLARALRPHHDRLAGKFLGALVAVALFDPAVASGIARGFQAAARRDRRLRAGRLPRHSRL